MKRWCEGRESLGKVRRARRGSRGSKTSFHIIPQHLGARQPSVQASTGCLQGFLQDVQRFLQDVLKRGFWRMDGGKKVEERVWR